MADDVTTRQEPSNPCCTSWQEKYIKLKERHTKLEKGRNALREGLSILEGQVSKMQSDNLSLRKALENEKVQADNEKVKESALRVSLESEVARLKNEILSLKQKVVGNDGGREIGELKERLSERESKVNELSDLVEKERMKAESEKKKAELEKKVADQLRTKLKGEKARANEEKRLADDERKRAEDNRLNFEKLKKEIDQVKLKLASVRSEFEDAKKQLEAEKGNTAKERRRANAAVVKAADQKKTAEANHKISMDEKSRANDLSQQLEQERQKTDNLEKQIGKLMLSSKRANNIPLEGATLNADAALKRLQEMEQNVEIEKKRVKSEMKNVAKQREVAEAYKKKALEEKGRADQLSGEAVNYRKRVEELQKEIEKLDSARSFVNCPPQACDSSVHVETAKVKLLKKQLKLEKRLAKHAKDVAKLEKTRNYMLRQNLCILKQELVHFSRRLNILDDCFFQGDLEKNCSLDSKNNYSGLTPYKMQSHFGNEMVPLSASGSDLSKQKLESNTSSLLLCGGNNSGPISGTNSKLEPLLRGFNEKVLPASLSDRLLVGSQERCASITTSVKSAEGKLNIEDTRKKCHENVVAIAESNSMSPPISCNSTERRTSHLKKMRRSVDVIESNGNLISEGKKRQRQLSGKTSLCDGLLNSRIEGPRDEKKHLEAAHLRSRKKRKTLCELGQHPLSSKSAAKSKFGSSGVKSDVCTRPFPTMYGVLEASKDWKKSKDNDLRDFGELVGCDYLKLLNLDNPSDEASYRLAIERPLSPTLPEIQCRRSVALESINSPLFEGFSNTMGTLASSGSFDVLNVEINSNQLEDHILDPSNNSTLSKQSDHGDSSKRLYLDTAGNVSCSSNKDALERLCSSDLAPASEGLKISSERRAVVSLYDGFAKYCIVFSNNYEEDSISSVYHATSSCVGRCFSTSDPSLKSILVALLSVEEISDKEKACVFISVLLLYISDTAARSFGDNWRRDLVLFVNSIAQQMYTELSDEDTRRMFIECCNFYDVLSLMEDFLLHGNLLGRAVSSDSDSIINLILDGHSISLCKQPASTQLLLTGGILLASVCMAVDHVGFVCEASCNILRVLRYDALDILHTFAYLCGSKYFTLEGYGLCMTVVKSLVMLIHKSNSSSAESLSVLCFGSKCPFSEGAVTTDVVASLLLDSLNSCACSFVGLDLAKCVGRRTEGISDSVDLVRSVLVTSGYSCQLIDTLALVELVANFTSWDWVFDKIACPLLNLLESCSTDHFTASGITTLLGQLGRLGLDALGREDSRIQRLRSCLSAFLRQRDSQKMGLCFQFSIGIALIGLIPLSFEELANIEVAPAGNPCDPTYCLNSWFAVLSNEERLVFKLVNSAGKTSWLMEHVQGYGEGDK